MAGDTLAVVATSAPFSPEAQVAFGAVVDGDGVDHGRYHAGSVSRTMA